MRKIITAAAMAAAFSFSGAAHAAMGDELQGHTVDVVFADGTQNSIYFGSNGQALVSGPQGSTMTANWYVQDDQLCLQSGGTQECWGYAAPFAAGQTMTLESGCDATSQWTARSVNAPAPMMTGERG